MKLTRDTYIGNIYVRLTDHPEEFMDPRNMKGAIGAIMRNGFIDVRTIGELVDTVGLEVDNWLLLHDSLENPRPVYRWLGPAKLQAFFSQLYLDGVIDEPVNVWLRIADFYAKKGAVASAECDRYLNEQNAENSLSNMEARKPD